MFTGILIWINITEEMSGRWYTMIYHDIPWYTMIDDWWLMIIGHIIFHQVFQTRIAERRGLRARGLEPIFRWHRNGGYHLGEMEGLWLYDTCDQGRNLDDYTIPWDVHSLQVSSAKTRGSSRNGKMRMKTERTTETRFTSGKHTKNHWTLPFIGDLPIKKRDFPLLC